MEEDTKKDIRQTILTRLKTQKEEDRLSKSRVIADKLFGLAEYKQAKTILFFASFAGEVNTFFMMQQAQKEAKRIALPVVNIENRTIAPFLVNCLEKDLENGPYSIKQPKTDKAQELPLSQLDLVIVPGVAFTYSGDRLGRGAGYYDHFLKTISSDVPTIGIAFDFQIVTTLPMCSHDVGVKHVLTD